MLKKIKSIPFHGDITPALLIITGAFIIIIYGLLFVLSLQFDFSQRQVSNDKALQISEAGINYFRWHLSVEPDDYTDEIETHDYKDQQGDNIGKFSLSMESPNESYEVVTI